MKTIINEFRNIGRCSRNIFEDVEIAKRIFDNMFISANEVLVIRGLIQEIRLYKFGYLMYSEKQVNDIYFSKRIFCYSFQYFLP
jgi:hypothetical protein